MQLSHPAGVFHAIACCQLVKLTLIGEHVEYQYHVTMSYIAMISSL